MRILQVPNSEVFKVEDSEKLLILAFHNNKLDSIAGRCKAKDFRSVV